MQTAPFIPSATQAIVSSILGLVIALGNGLAPLFGVTPVPNEIPSEKVTAMETDSTSKN